VRTSPSVLRIDDRYAARADREVVDVGSATGDSAVVQKLHAMSVEVLLKSRGNTLLTLRAARPCTLVLGLAQLRQADTDASKADSVPRRSPALLAH
jgi:hypothetical protein